MHKYLSLALSLVLLGTPLAAQSVIGTTIIDGRRVEVLDDGSWRYADGAEQESCQFSELNIQFCGSRSIWKYVRQANADIDAQFQYDDRTYALIIAEGLGTSDGLTLETLKQIAIENAAFDGRDPAQIPVFELQDQMIQDREIDTMVYSVSYQSLDFIYINSIYVDGKRSFQAITYSVGSELTDEHRNVHERFLNEFSIDGAGQ